MKKTLLVTAFAMLCATPACLFAQNHGEAGVFGEYFRLQRLDANLGGVGGRFSVNVRKHFQLEGELSYLFRRGFVERFGNGIPSGFTSTRSSVRAINGLFGPKWQRSGAIRPFVTIKGGFLSTEFNPNQGPGPGFTSQINNLRRTNTAAVLYPGAGVAGFWGPIGLRFDVGDYIFFDGGHANHNLRMTFGPHFRF